MNSDEEKHNSKYEDKNRYNMDWNFAQICVLYRYDKRERSVSLGSQRSTQAGLYSAPVSYTHLLHCKATQLVGAVASVGCRKIGFIEIYRWDVL